MVRTRFLILAATVLVFVGPRVHSADTEKQAKLIAILTSNAPPGEKAIACKQLAIYGHKEAVPALAPLLEDKDLASWARIALEAIPGSEANEALRSALPKLQGNLLIGAINSLGVRRDEKSIDALAGKAGSSDPAVAGAAAVALGKIGGTHSASVLGQMLGNAPEQILPAVAEGCILCAERFHADGKASEAIALYEAVRNKTGLAAQKKLEATRGSILARGNAGLPLLLQQLRSQNSGEVGMALRTARELNGRGVTEALGAELARAEADRQVPLLLALSDRKDEAVFPLLLQAAEKGTKATRVSAVGQLDRFGQVSSVPILLGAAAEADAEIAVPAKATLTRMEGKPVDAELVKRLPGASGKTRQVIIELAALRRIHEAVPAVLASAEDEDPNIRRAAFSTLSTLGSERETGDLARLLAKSRNADDREAIENSLMGICGRNGTKCLPHVLPLTKHEDSEVRLAGLRALATIGGPEALTAVTAAMKDSDEGIQDEAVGILATWPNNWPEDTTVTEPLLSLARSGSKPAHKVQGLRGYFLHLQENKKLSNAEKLNAIDRLLPGLQRPAEKRLAIATLGTIPTARSIEVLSQFAQDNAIAEEAAVSLVSVATARNFEGEARDARLKALEWVGNNAKNEETRNKARSAAKTLK